MTTSIWADVVSRATCADELGIDVVTLIPSNADPHDYEPSMQDRETLTDAELVVFNGLDLEAGYADLLSSVDDDRLVEIASFDTVTVSDHDDDAADDDEHADHDHDEGDEHDEGEEHEEHDEHEDDDHAEDGDEHEDHGDEDEDDDHAEDGDEHEDHGDEDEDGDHDDHDHAEGDPHLWMDPQMVAASVHPLADAVVTAAGADADAVEACADEYVDELDALDDEIAEMFDALDEEQRMLVTNHDAYGYFADRYGLDVIGTILPATTTLAETNPADLNDLRGDIEATGTRAIVIDAEHSSDDAEALADAIDGVEVVALYNGGLGDHESYRDMMHANATELADALGG